MVNTRVMTAGDYDAVYDLWIHTPGMGLNASDDGRDGIGKFLKRNPTTCYAAECGGRIVGVIMAGHDGRRGYIYHTAVLPEYRNQGIARKLVDCAMSALEAEESTRRRWLLLRQTRLGTDSGKASDLRKEKTWFTGTKTSIF